MLEIIEKRFKEIFFLSLTFLLDSDPAFFFFFFQIVIHNPPFFFPSILTQHSSHWSTVILIIINRPHPPQQLSAHWDPPNTQASIVMDATRRRARARWLDAYIRAHRIRRVPVGLREEKRREGG